MNLCTGGTSFGTISSYGISSLLSYLRVFPAQTTWHCLHCVVLLLSANTTRWGLTLTILELKVAQLTMRLLYVWNGSHHSDISIDEYVYANPRYLCQDSGILCALRLEQTPSYHSCDLLVCTTESNPAFVCSVLLNLFMGKGISDLLHGVALGHLYYLLVDAFPIVYGNDTMHTVQYLNGFGGLGCMLLFHGSFFSAQKEK